MALGAMRLEQYPSHILLHSARDCALWEMQNLNRGAAVAILFHIRSEQILSRAALRSRERPSRMLY
jgi:hypothetical protein